MTRNSSTFLTPTSTPVSSCLRIERKRAEKSNVGGKGESEAVHRKPSGREREVIAEGGKAQILGQQVAGCSLMLRLGSFAGRFGVHLV